jgi:hypothetical protein
LPGIALALSVNRKLISQQGQSQILKDELEISVDLPNESLNLYGAMSLHIRHVLEMTKGKVHGKGRTAQVLV